LHPKAVLYKPFRRDQLLETIELMLDPAKAIPGKVQDGPTRPAPAVTR
jgi:hypothetical protein